MYTHIFMSKVHMYLHTHTYIEIYIYTHTHVYTPHNFGEWRFGIFSVCRICWGLGWVLTPSDFGWIWDEWGGLGTDCLCCRRLNNWKRALVVYFTPYYPSCWVHKHPTVNTFSVIGGNLIPQSVKCIHSATILQVHRQFERMRLGLLGRPLGFGKASQ